MGKSWSKENHQVGDTNIEITEHLEENSNSHNSHEIKLWIIISLLCIQLLVTIYKLLKRKWKRQGFEQAKQLSTLNIQTA